MSKQVAKSKTAQGGIPMRDVKPTYVPPGYVKEQHSGKAENAGDQSRIETHAQKGGVVAKVVPAK